MSQGVDPWRLRIGDAEREAAVTALGEHFATGRLSQDEFEQRSTAAWSATTHAALVPLFGDLPAPYPPGPGGPSRTVVHPAAPTGSSRPGFHFPWVPALLVLVFLSAVTDAPWWLLGLALWVLVVHRARHGWRNGRDRRRR